MATATFPPTGNVVLEGVPWEIYDRLRSEEANRNLRMTYWEGTLQMMSPSKLHERIAHLLGRFVDAWTEEGEVTVQGCGATTFRREDLQRGLDSLTSDGGYAGGAASLILPGFPLREAVRLVAERNRIDETRLARLFRSHVRAGDAAGPDA